MPVTEVQSDVGGTQEVRNFPALVREEDGRDAAELARLRAFVSGLQPAVFAVFVCLFLCVFLWLDFSVLFLVHVDDLNH